MTSATDELRRLLDERGVEHFDATECTLWGYEQTSDSTGCYRCAADEVGEGFMTLRMHHITPAQAIDATLGRGTCHSANVTEYAWDDFECSECGWITWNFVMEHEGCGTVQQPRYCPNCGKRVVYDQ